MNTVLLGYIRISFHAQHQIAGLWSQRYVTPRIAQSINLRAVTTMKNIKLCKMLYNSPRALLPPVHVNVITKIPTFRFYQTVNLNNNKEFYFCRVSPDTLFFSFFECQSFVPFRAEIKFPFNFLNRSCNRLPRLGICNYSVFRLFNIMLSRYVLLFLGALHMFYWAHRFEIQVKKKSKRNAL